MFSPENVATPAVTAAVSVVASAPGPDWIAAVTTDTESVVMTAPFTSCSSTTGCAVKITSETVDADGCVAMESLFGGSNGAVGLC